MELADILDEESTPTPIPAAPEPAAVVTTPAVAAEATPAPAAAPEGQQRGPDGKFVAKSAEATPAAPAAPEATPQPAEQPRQQLTDKERAFLRAAQEERTKRQQLEARIAEMERKPAEPAKQFWDDPDAALRTQTEQITAVRQEMQNALITERVQTSHYNAQQKYPDLDVKIDEFLQAVQEVPGLQQQFLASPNPVEFAYKTAKSRIELREAGGIEQLLVRKEAEIRAKVELELSEKQKKADELRATVPGSLSNVAGGTGNQSAPAWGGPSPLADILAR